MGKRRFHSVAIDIEIAEILEQCDDELIRDEYFDRFGSTPAPAFDMLDELHWLLLNGRTQYALAMIESAQNERAIPEAQRQQQFQRGGLIQ